MDIRVLSWYMLLPQVGAIVFLLMVISQQIKLLGRKIQADLKPLRWQLLGMALAILFLVAIVLMISIVTVLGLVTRSANHINGVGILISCAYNGFMFLASVLIWNSYRLAGKISLVAEERESGNKPQAGAQ